MRAPWLIVLLSASAFGADKLLGNDSFNGSGSVYSGVNLAEYAGAGVVLTPSPGDYPLTLKAVDILCVPATGQPAGQIGAYLLDVWSDEGGPLPLPGYLDGGTNSPIVNSNSGGIQLTSAVASFNRVMLTPAVVVNSGRLFITVREQTSSQEDFTTLATDMGPIVPGANWYFETGGYFDRVDDPDGGPSLYMIPGNWIIRAVLDVPNTDGGTGGGGGGSGVGGGGAGTGGGSGTGGGASTGGGTGTGGGSATGGGGSATGGGSGTGGGSTGDGGTAVLSVESITPAEGDDDVATPVVIIGGGFLTVTDVLVGPKVLTGFTVKSASVIEATVPSGMKAGVYDVEVIDAAGEMATLKMAFTARDAKTAKSGCGCDGSGSGLQALLLFAGAALLFKRRVRA